MADLKKGMSFFLVLLGVFLIVLFIPGFGKLYAILGVGGILFPAIIMLKAALKK